jgi:hypothetical protein
LSAETKSISTLDLLLVGLPDSGKSTYLGALFHGLKSNGSDGLALDRLPEERDYLIELENEWLSLRPLERSRHHGPKHIELPLRDEQTHRSFVLVVPDIVGEEYETAWEDGVWSDGVRERVSRSDGLLLFIRADDIREPSLIDAQSGASSPEIDRDRTPWGPKDSPTQAKLCDLLEQVADVRGGDVPPVAVIIAAWDVVADTGVSADAWLEWQTPLLWQWLQSQAPDAEHRVFAVSAQGGDLRQKKVRAKLARHAERRPIPKGADALTKPLRWLLERVAT